MNKFKIKTIIISMVLLVIVNFSSRAQTSDFNNTNEILTDNSKLFRVFYFINSLNKEADKQEIKGFSKRADMLRNHIQKKTNITGSAKIKLNLIASAFQIESENINNQIKEISSDGFNQTITGNNAYKLKKLVENRNKLYDSSREALSKYISDEDK